MLIWLEGAGWFFLAALVVLEVLARKESESKRLFEDIGIVYLAVFVPMDFGTFLYGVRHEELASPTLTTGRSFRRFSVVSF
jgi:hypothetical protein